MQFMEVIMIAPNQYPTRLLHTMLRDGDLEKSIAFYTHLLGMKLLRSQAYNDGEYTLAFIGYQDEADGAVLELNNNWGKDLYELGTAFSYLALVTHDIYETCEALATQGVNITRLPGPMRVMQPFLSHFWKTLTATR
jgi:lactoylglutathione lyase